LLAKWWAAGDIAPVVGHTFTLDMGAFGHVPCRVLDVVSEERLVFTFTEDWTLTWTLSREGEGTRLHLEHAGFDLTNAKARHAFERMGPGWRDEVLPRIAQVLDAAEAAA
jgi:uncharacterized protein YndB with AHSA1/START domain